MITDRHTLSGILDTLKKNGNTIVFTNGCFDIIHAGHVYYLAEAAKHGDCLVIGLNSDSSVKKLKGDSRPVNNEEDRAMVLSALRFVDYVTVFDEETPYELIKLLLPDVLVKGGDYTFDTIVGADIVSVNGGKVITIPLLTGRSTTNTIEKLKK
jgi:rfaE bifunctional protein nucleotidyltransferase chain/domain